jgi:hypothetical protein
MASLRSLFPEIGRILNMTAPALYGRQVAFIRSGVLKSKRGHGPGSGVPATAEALATFLVAEMVNATQRENAPYVPRLMEAWKRSAPGSGDGPKCELTAATRFGPALVAILSKPELAARVTEIEVSKSRITISFDGDENWSDFSVKPDSAKMFDSLITGEVVYNGIERTAILGGDEIRALAKLVTRS